MTQENLKSQVTCIPQPRFKAPILGHLIYFKSDLKETLSSLSLALGPIYRFKLGTHNIVVVSGLELIKEVCDDSRFEKNAGGPFWMALKRDIFKEGFALLQTDDPLWVKINHLFLPGFSTKAIREYYFPLMLEIMEELFIKWDKTPEKTEINLNEEFSLLVLDFIGLCGFNYHFHAISSEKIHPFPKAVGEIFKQISETLLLPKFLQKLQFRKNKKYDHNVSLINKYADNILVEREKQAETSKEHKDFLHLLLNEKVSEGKFDTSFIRTQIIAILVAGHETTASLLSFAFYALLTYPTICEKAYEEVDRVLGTDLSKPSSPQNFQNLTYINQILNECLRLWSGFFIERTPRNDTLLGGKYPIKKGESIWTFLDIVRKDKVIWGKDADSFNPDRFAPELEAKRDPCAFLPFGIGKRACLGRQFAMFEATLTLAMILQRYRLHLRPGYKFGTVYAVSLHPATLWVTLEKRKNHK